MWTSGSLSAWRRRHFGIRALASCLFVLGTAITALHFLGIPNLQRLHLQVGLSLFDYGYYGFYPTHKYKTVDYESPAVEISRRSSRCSDQLTFMAPHGNAVEYSGPMILDPRGNLVWMMPFIPDQTQDFRVQEYHGEKYLTFWHGISENGHGQGSWSMVGWSLTLLD